MENLGGWDPATDHPDFDPNLLNVESWGVDHQTEDIPQEASISNSNHSRRFRKKSSGSWGDSQWSSLGVTDFDQPEDSGPPTIKQESNPNATNNLGNTTSNTGNNLHGVVGIPSETVEAAVEAAVAAISETSDSVNSGDRSGGSSEKQRLHPMGIQSSASCPAPEHTVQQVQQAYQQQQQLHQQQLHQQQQQLHQQQQHHSLQGSTVTQPTITNTAPAATQNLNTLAANFMLAQAANSSVAATAAAAAAASSGGEQHAASVISQHSILQQSSNTTKTASNRRRGTGTRPKSNATKSKKKKSAKKKKKSANSNEGAAAGQLPPFYLFDAPIELRANFMQNQRRLGLPIQHDPNSYHYGETVNGFHPHQYQLPFGATTQGGANGAAVAAAPVRPSNAPPPQLIDARHGNHRRNKGGQVKNEREQKRAQKITELIEQLRLQMEKGGWQVEARSKFHTLSNCAQYIKHMITLTSEKEKENSKLNVELDEKRRKLERENEEKAMQEGRSDPESVTSSLTSDTTMSTARHKQEEEGENDEKKRKLPDSSSKASDDSNNNSSSNNDANNSNDTSNKKHRISSEATTEDSSADDNRGGSGTGSGGSGSGGLCKTISSVSELTDSNRGSSSNNSGSGGGSSDDVPTEQDSRESTSGNREETTDQPSTSSISSDAAVASEKTSRDRNTGHKDVVFNNKTRKRPPEEVTSLERTFELNYEEVFHKSTIPQLIASTSGKIVTWNECFCKATGYRKSEIESMTIFSLVKPENLANFFEIVAAALRPDDEENAKGNNPNCEEENETEESSSGNSSNTDNSKQNTISESPSSQDSLSGHDTVVCRNNEKGSGEDGDIKNHNLEKKTNDSVVATKEESENIVSGNSANEESSSNNSEEEGSKMETESSEEERKITVSGSSGNEESSSNSGEEEGINRPNTDNASGNSANEESSSNSSENKPETTNEEASDESAEKREDNGQLTKDTMESSETQKGSHELISKSLLNYTAMTLPCIDFPAMIKRNQAARESNAVTIPSLHVTVTLMPDEDPRRRCFHCVFTNSKGTNGALGIITPELLASLFSTPLRNSNRRHKKSAHQHQRKRARGGTTRVGQSVSTLTVEKDEQKHHVQHIVSTNEADEKPPSPLLMPPPGPLAEDNSKPEENEPKASEIEMTD